MTESINEEAVIILSPDVADAAIKALLRRKLGLLAPSANNATIVEAVGQATAVITAVLPLLRLSDVPGLERQLRDKIAGEDAALLMAADSVLSLIRYRRPSALNEQTVRDLDDLLPKLRKRTDAAVRAARIARGSSS